MLARDVLVRGHGAAEASVAAWRATWPEHNRWLVTTHSSCQRDLAIFHSALLKVPTSTFIINYLLKEDPWAFSGHCEISWSPVDSSTTRPPCPALLTPLYITAARRGSENKDKGGSQTTSADHILVVLAHDPWYNINMVIQDGVVLEWNYVIRNIM